MTDLGAPRDGRQLSTVFLAGCLLLGAVLSLAGACTPGYLRPADAPYLVVFGVVAAVLAGFVWWRRRVSAVAESVVLYLALVGGVLTLPVLTDRADARMLPGLFVLVGLFGTMFLGLRPMLAMLLAVGAATAFAMRYSGDTWALTCMHTLLSLSATVGPCLMVALLRRRLAGALERSVHQATTDPLTGLANRRGLVERAPTLINQAGRRGIPVGFLLVDIDGLAAINESYGSHAGDDVLREVAQAIRTCVRGVDVVVRVGGEELAVLAVLGPRPLVALAERIRTAVAEQCGVTVSIGVSWASPTPGMHPDTFLRGLYETADGHLYTAKHAGRNRVEHPKLVVPR